MRLSTTLHAIILGMAASLMLGCNNAELDRLRKENAELKQQLETVSNQSGPKFLGAAIEIQDAARYSKNFRENASEVKIPLTWEFETAELNNLSANNAKVRFYAAINDAGYMKLIACGVDHSNNDVYYLADGTTSALRDYAQTCPSDICANNNGPAGSASVLHDTDWEAHYVFKRVGKEKKQ